MQTICCQFSNDLGSSSLELDEDAEVLTYEEYYPYGNSSYQAGLSLAEVSRKRYRYVGKERDDESGFIYIGARYYCPWLARWLAPDPINNEWYNLCHGNPTRNLEPQFVELTASSYEYCYANPIRFTDLTGEQPKPIEYTNLHTTTTTGVNPTPATHQKNSVSEKPIKLSPATNSPNTSQNNLNNNTVVEKTTSLTNKTSDSNKTPDSSSSSIDILSGNHQGTRYVIYDKKEMKAGTIPWRTNNPGDIRSSRYANEHGAVGNANGFAVFPDYKTGFDAVAPLLKGKGYRDSTIAGAISRYAPSGDNNDPISYAASISKATGLADTLLIKNLTDSQLIKVVKQIENVEGYNASTNKIYTFNKEDNPKWVDSIFHAINKPDTVRTQAINTH